MTIHYKPDEIEPKWREFWKEKALLTMKEHSRKPKYYLLMMFPYPSGILHVGHGRNYIIGDAVARYKAMCGYNVLNPMGWDAFGLPAENQALRKGVHPKVSTMQNIGSIKKQLWEWGAIYDWSREIASCHPGYYRWTQWLFLKFYERGLVHRKLASANWCTHCLTTIANEQVHDGNCERCGATVIQKDLNQWFFKTSQYAQRLLDDLELLNGWPERVRVLQKNWIGRSEGAEIFFKVLETGEKLPCFTTRPDTLWGVTFMSLAPEHPIISSLVKGTDREQDVMDFVDRVRNMKLVDRSSAKLEKEGVFTGKHIINPVNGKKAQLWVANYALMEYGTGAVMAVPAHDQRDFEFARKYNLPIEVVIQPKGETLASEEMKEAYVQPGEMVNSGPFDGKISDRAIPKIIDYLDREQMGKKAINYRLRDWNISRQRYWGCPIPFVHCDSCGIVPVPERDLPVLLPDEVEDYKPKGKSVLAGVPSFLHTVCPACGKKAHRETDTMDTFVDSSWYFLRYLSPREENKPFSTVLANNWMPVDQYVGGIEHATMHLIYARFFTKVLQDIGLIDFSEPFKNLFTQGMLCKESYRSKSQLRYLSEQEYKKLKGQLPTGDVDIKLEKMSKSKLNVVSPDNIIAKYGVDTMRLYILFIGPPIRDAEWNDDAVQGAYRFLIRFWNLLERYHRKLSKIKKTTSDLSGLSGDLLSVYRKAHQTVKKVTGDMEGDFHFNTAIAAIMELINFIKGYGDYASAQEQAVLKDSLEKAVLLISPMTPHIGEEMWRMLGHKGSVFTANWPAYDPNAIVEDMLQIVLQINGKVRSRIEVEASISKTQLQEKALQDSRVKNWLDGKKPRKVIVVPGKLVNIVF